MKEEGFGPLFLCPFLKLSLRQINFGKNSLFRPGAFVYNKTGFVSMFFKSWEGQVMTMRKNLRKATDAPQENEPWQKTVLLYLHDLIYMMAGIVIVFLLVFRMVVVSGSSMYSTLWDGDWLIVLSNVFYQEPEYGDIIVACKDSFNDGEAIIKRVIATEGQTVDIDFDAGIVYVDGIALEESYTYTPTNIWEGTEFPLVVAEGCVFAMGDNRNESLDGRDPRIGQIDKREILGKAIFLLYPGMGEDYAERDLDRIGALK